MSVANLAEQNFSLVLPLTHRLQTEYLGAMTEYVNFSDLKGIIIGVIGSALWFAIYRYWSNRSIKSMRRSIEEKEAYKARLDNLARSDRSLLITGFQAVLAILAFICGIVPINFLLFFGQTDILNAFIFVLLWSLPILFCWGIVKMLQDIQGHPQSLEKIDKRITELKNKLLGQNK